MKKGAKRIGKGVLFMAIFILIFFAVGFFMQPYWENWDNQYVTRGFYEEPKNTIETIFIGASMSTAGIIPTELYRDYGICTYNLGTGAQPVMMSYFFMKDAYRYQSESLKTVVFDVSMIRRLTTDAMYHKVLDFMPFSSVKLEAISAFSSNYKEYLANLFPLLTYHDRWEEIGRSDFDKFGFEPMSYIRGYNYESHRIFDDYSYLDMPVPLQVADDSVEETEFSSETMYYLKQIIDFCSEKNLKLVFLKTPSAGNWTSASHNSVQAIADRYGLDFLDFDTEPLINEIDFIPALDCRDSDKHLNYHGATKFTKRLGKYLSEECGLTDVRGDERYAFMDEQLADYESHILGYHKAVETEDIASYLEELAKGNFTVLIALKDVGNASLTDDQRSRIAALGFKRLPKLGFRTSYIGVMENGKMVRELSLHEPVYSRVAAAAEEEANDDGGPVNDLENIEFEAAEEVVEASPITYKSMCPDGTGYTITSGSHNMGNIASILFPDGEKALNERGLNIVVYNNDTHLVQDSVVFDVHYSVSRRPYDLEKELDEAEEAGIPFEELEDDLKKLALYKASLNLHQQGKHVSEQMSSYAMPALLKYYLEQEGLCVAIAVKDDAAKMLTPEARKALTDIGFEKIADLGKRDSYLAFAVDGEIVYEELDHGETPLKYVWNDCVLKSGGRDSGYIASLEIDGIEMMPNIRGFDVVVFDPDLKVAVESRYYDTTLVELDPAPYSVDFDIDREAAAKAAYDPAKKEE